MIFSSLHLRGGIMKWLNKHFIVIYIILTIISALISIFIYGEPSAHAFLRWSLLYCVGIFGIVSFFLHWFQKSADKIARGIGWEPGSPFQKEVAAADGAFGVLGLASYWVGEEFWMPTVIGYSFMIFFMGIGHVIDIAKRGNKSPLNAGSIVWYGLLFPVALITLLILWKTGY